MHSAVLVLGLLAGGVLSSPAHLGHGHMHNARQVEVVDVVDVYTTVTLSGPAPTPAPVHSSQPEEKVKVAAPPVAAPPVPAPASVSSAPAPPPSSTSVPPPSSSPASSSGNDYLDVHNNYRSSHGAVPMAWNSDLANKAQSEVNSCPSNDVQSGSNWFGSSGSSSVASALGAWYGEMATYASQTNNYANNPPANPPQGAPETGHFSQMIWNASTSLGCATNSACPGSWATQVTCLYEPAGNMVFNGVPQYTENVFAPGSTH